MFLFSRESETDFIITLFRVFKSLAPRGKVWFIVYSTIIALIIGALFYLIIWCFGRVEKAEAQRQIKYEAQKQYDIISRDELGGNHISIIKFRGTGCYYIATQSLDLALHDRMDSFVPYLNKEGKQVCE